MGNRFIAFALCAACCALIAVGCSHDSTPTSAPNPAASAPPAAPPDAASVASKVISDMSALPPAQRGRYIGLHQQEIMMATQDPKSRQKIISLMNGH